MILLISLTLFLLYVVQFYWNVRKYPKGPLPLPLIGNLYQIDPKKLHLNIKHFAKQYGKVFTIWFMDRPFVILSHYDSIKEALHTNGEALAFRPSDYTTEVMQPTENGGIVFSNGDNWREQKKTGMHILRDFGVGKNIMEHKIMVANIINQVLFGCSFPHEKCDRLIQYTEKMNSIFAEINASFLPFVVSCYPILRRIPAIDYKATGQFKERFNQCFEMTKNDVAKCLDGFSKEDQPNCFAQAYYKQIGNNPYIDQDNLYNSCLDFFVAGMETTTNALRWVLIYYAKYPKMQEKVRREIAKVVGFSRLPSLSDKNKMPYMQSVILEIQRHSNVLPAGLLHLNSKEVTIDGQQIPEGTTIMPQVYEVLSSEEQWGNPEEFVPERFLTDDGTINQDLASKVIVFGMGKRVCAGEGLAKTEIFLFATALVQKYHFLPPIGKEVNMSYKFGLTFQPEENHLQLKDVNPKEYI